MNKYIFFIVFATIITTNYYSIAQESKAHMEFETTEYNFGDIKEENGKVSYEFRFKNTGTSPLIITMVSSSCGCTTPYYTREPVMPQKEGSIKVEFDPTNRPGQFIKTITIKSNADNSPITLRITGNVIENKKINNYRYKIGDLRLENIHFQIGNITKGEIKSKSIGVYNTSNTPIKIEFKDNPKYIIMNVHPVIIPPQSYGEITCVYNTNLTEEWDYIIDRIKLSINGKLITENNLVVTAIIQEDFSKLTENYLKRAPIAYFENNTFDFGEVKQGTKVPAEFLLINKGKENLIIRKIYSSCGCTIVQPEKKIISSGESIKIKAIFDTSSRVGDQTTSVYVITNDPKNYKQVLKIYGKVIN